ncbi:MAG: class I SAM-dependent methyltransferase [Planctomycetes bacterium]|nr:class I SAM-dependent methyltransferase [Planctomycetota bacterium]
MRNPPTMRKCATSLEGEMTKAEHEFLLGLLRREKFEGAHLEVGTAAGGTLCVMMRAFDDATRPQFVVVDRMTYFPNQMEAVDINLRRHNLDPAKVDFRVAMSTTAFREATERGDTFDFILLDGGHKILNVMADLRWTRLLNVGGMICLHDCVPKFPGVKLSVDRFLAGHPHFQIVGQADSLIALQKVSAATRPEVSRLDRAYALAMHLPLLTRRKLDKWRSKRAA